MNTMSFQIPNTSNCNNEVPNHLEKENLDQSSSKKRKMMDADNYVTELESTLTKKSKPTLSLNFSTKSCRVESQLETPLPLDWQQCLDIQSGKVHFYNTRTETRTSRDPRDRPGSLELPRSKSPHMRLDLELNLPFDNDSSNPKNNKLNTDLNSNSSSKEEESHDLLINFGTKDENKKINISTKKSSRPSWLAFEGDEKSEMVATVCKKCFMLVMLCKASPACPNCKFMHSPDQRLTQLLY